MVLDVYKRLYDKQEPVMFMDEVTQVTYCRDKPKELCDRFEFVFTPKHGRWLNMAEIELNVLIGQCLGAEFPQLKKLSGRHQIVTASE